MGSGDQKVRPARDAFFVLDSDHLEEAGSALYGFAFRDGMICERVEDLNGGEPEEDGAYVYIRREGSRITVTQDYAGSFGLYLFRKDGWFALSNSFLMLTEYVGERYPVTLNREYADYMLAADLCSAVYGETLIREIVMLDRCAVVEIDIPARKLEIRYKDYQENTVDPGSAEGIAILDAWRDKWVSRIRAIFSGGENIREDLTGGFDSRETLSLFLSSGIDMNRILVYSHTDQLHTHKEDFEIASEIAERYGFRLNNQDNVVRQGIPSPVEEVLARSFYPKLGFHKQMYFKREWNAARLFTFTGNGGECIRDYWHETEQEYTDKAVKRCDAFAGSPETCERLKRSTREVLSRSIRAMREHFSAAGRPIAEADLAPTLYRETRCRHHFGKQSVEAYLANIIMLSPLLDSQLYKLKLSSEGCGDRNLLSALIPERYAKGLLEIRFDSGRSVLPETVEYVRNLNSRFPCGQMPALTRPESVPQGDGLQAGAFTEDPAAVLRNLFLSGKIRRIFTSCYDRDTYRIIVADTEKRRYFPLTIVYAVFGIVRALQAEKPGARPGTPWPEFLAAQAPAAEREVRRAERIRASFAYRAARRLKRAAKAMLHR